MSSSFMVIEMIKEDANFLKQFIAEASRLSLHKSKDIVMDMEAEYIDWEKMFKTPKIIDYKPEFPDWLIATRQLMNEYNKEKNAEKV